MREQRTENGPLGLARCESPVGPSMSPLSLRADSGSSSQALCRGQVSGGVTCSLVQVDHLCAVRVPTPAR